MSTLTFFPELAATGVSSLFPTYRWLCAPAGLATRRQLAARGLRPGRQPIAGEIVWRNGRRVAYLYRADLAEVKRPATPAQLAALDRAMRARRTCPSCGRDVGYCLPRRWPACLDCQDDQANQLCQAGPDYAAPDWHHPISPAAPYSRETAA